MTHPLLDKARLAAQRSYSPYSGFSVGCAVESVDGEVALGANMENASFPVGICAEAAALAAAQQAFGLEKVARVAVVGGRLESDGRLSGSTMVTSCGGCRQSILEAANASKRDLEVLFASGDASRTATAKISQLLPLAFVSGAFREG